MYVHSSVRYDTLPLLKETQSTYKGPYTFVIHHQTYEERGSVVFMAAA